jgi:uncharacterized protein YecE (DUF72 family)
MLELDLLDVPPHVHVGTSSFSSGDWKGPFYPAGTPASEYLRYYAARLRAVEIDATFYAEPAPSTVDGWDRKTPADFVFAAKVPKTITHDRALEGCEAELGSFVRVMERLGPKLGALLLQFPYVSRRDDPEEWRTGARIRERLARFLPLLPAEPTFVVEVRNEAWIGDPLVELLTRHDVGLALTAYRGMPSPEKVVDRIGEELPGSVAYIRFLGDHRKMDRMVADAIARGDRRREWESLLVDRDREVADVVPLVDAFAKRDLDTYVFFNNHYAGFAPGSIDRFLRAWRELRERDRG